MDASWMIDEFAYAGPEHLDAAYVAGYDRKAGYEAAPEYATGIEEDLAALTGQGLDETATVVDIGAGTGRLALAAASLFRRVVAVDISPAMLDRLRDLVAEAEITNLECAHAGFLSYEHTGPPADAVCTRNALHQLPDFWKAIALDRIARMLRPGGVLRVRDLVFDFPPAEASDVIGRWMDHAADDPSCGYTRDDFAEHLRTEYSTYRWLFEPMLTATGFEIVEASFRGSVYTAYTCVRR